MMSKGCRVYFHDDKNFLKLILVMYAQLSEYTKSYWKVQNRLLDSVGEGRTALRHVYYLG